MKAAEDGGGGGCGGGGGGGEDCLEPSFLSVTPEAGDFGDFWVRVGSALVGALLGCPGSNSSGSVVSGCDALLAV